MEPNVNVDDSYEVSIDLMELVGVVRQKLGYIILVGILFAAVAMAYKMFLYKPEYTSTIKLYVVNRQSQDNTSALTQSDLQSSALLTQDYVDLIETRTVMESVIAKLGLDMDYKQLLAKVSVSTETNSRIITIDVSDDDPYEAWQIAKQIQEEASANITAVVKTDAITTAQQPNIATVPSNAIGLKMIILAAVAGMVLAAIIFCIIYIMDDKFSTPEDAARYLGLGTLGSIPIDDDLVKDKKRRMKARKRNRRKHYKG